MGTKTLTKQESERIRQNLDAAVSFMPYKDTIQEIANLPQDKRQILADPTQQGITYETALELGVKSINHKQFDLALEFCRFFAQPNSAESYLRMLEYIEGRFEGCRRIINEQQTAD